MSPWSGSSAGGIWRRRACGLSAGIPRSPSSSSSAWVLAAIVALPGVVAGAVVSEGDEPSVVAWILIGLGLFLGYTVTVFFGVAIVHAAARVLDGEDATVGEAIGFAFTRLGPILGWSVVGAAVSLFFAFLRSRGGAIGNILAGLGGAAWSLVTFLAVPVIAFEGLGPFATLRRSASLFRARWGEQITGSIGIGFVFFLLSLPGLVLAGIGFAVATSQAAVAGWALAVVGILLVAAVTVVGRAASAAFGAVLYRYAANGVVSEPFAEGDLRSVARPA
jgi:Family of unknown function (DUF6159)